MVLKSLFFILSFHFELIVPNLGNILLLLFMLNVVLNSLFFKFDSFYIRNYLSMRRDCSFKITVLLKIWYQLIKNDQFLFYFWRDVFIEAIAISFLINGFTSLNNRYDWLKAFLISYCNEIIWVDSYGFIQISQSIICIPESYLTSSSLINC